MKLFSKTHETWNAEHEIEESLGIFVQGIKRNKMLCPGAVKWLAFSETSSVELLTWLICQQDHIIVSA